jgi:hypothetical protein
MAQWHWLGALLACLALWGVLEVCDAQGTFPNATAVVQSLQKNYTYSHTIFSGPTYEYVFFWTVHFISLVTWSARQAVKIFLLLFHCEHALAVLAP